MWHLSGKWLAVLCIVSSWHTGAAAACISNPATLTIDVGTINIGTGSVVAVGSVIKTMQGKWTAYGSNSTQLQRSLRADRAAQNAGHSRFERDVHYGI